MTKKKDPKDLKKRGPKVKHDHLTNLATVNYMAHLAAEGVSDEEICLKVGISRTTLHRFKKKHPELWNKIVSTTEDDIRSIESSLFKSAKGHTKQTITYNGDGTIKEIKETYVPPQAWAVGLYLYNRAPARWKSRVEHDHEIEELPLSINFVSSDSRALNQSAIEVDSIPVNEQETKSDSEPAASPISDTNDT